MKIPDTVTFEALQQALDKRAGKIAMRGLFDYERVGGTGCVCEDCQKERAALYKELQPKVHEEHKRRIKLACPQRAAHELEKDNAPKVEPLKTFTCPNTGVMFYWSEPLDPEEW